MESYGRECPGWEVKIQPQGLRALLSLVKTPHVYRQQSYLIEIGIKYYDTMHVQAKV